TLFATVLGTHLRRVHDDVTFTADDLPGYAAKVFDFAMANPDLMRLLAWSALEQEAKDQAERGATLDAKEAALAEAQDAGRVGTAFAPDFLVRALLSLATAWSAAGALGPPLDPKAAGRRANLRQSIVEAVRLLASAGKGTRTQRRRKVR